MKLAIMQPYFFPYLGYFQLIHSTDKFILFDDVQYIRRGWINRNRILKPEDGVQYITMPIVEHSRDTLIKNIKISNDSEWKFKIIRQLEHYKKKAPFYNQTMQLITACFDNNEKNIALFNASCLRAVCDYIGMDCSIEISSNMNFNYSNVNDAGEWALRICDQLKASEYINPCGGKNLFSEEKFSVNGIKLNFIYPNLPEYNQRRNSFEAGLSIIDMMMNVSPENIFKYLNEFEIKK